MMFVPGGDTSIPGRSLLLLCRRQTDDSSTEGGMVQVLLAFTCISCSFGIFIRHSDKRLCSKSLYMYMVRYGGGRVGLVSGGGRSTLWYMYRYRYRRWVFYMYYL